MIFTAFWLLEAFTSHILAASFPFTSRWNWKVRIVVDFQWHKIGNKVCQNLFTDSRLETQESLGYWRIVLRWYNCRKVNHTQRKHLRIYEPRWFVNKFKLWGGVSQFRFCRNVSSPFPCKHLSLIYWKTIQCFACILFSNFVLPAEFLDTSQNIRFRCSNPSSNFVNNRNRCCCPYLLFYFVTYTFTLTDIFDNLVCILVNSIT
jgi:hypothetical protein